MFIVAELELGARHTMSLALLQNTAKDYHHEVGQNLSLVKIDTDYFHQFDCLISEECEIAQCMDCRTIFRNGNITQHTQFIRIRYQGSWIISVLRKLLHSVCQQQIRDARMVVPILQQNHVVLPEQPREK